MQIQGLGPSDAHVHHRGPSSSHGSVSCAELPGQSAGVACGAPGPYSRWFVHRGPGAAGPGDPSGPPRTWAEARGGEGGSAGVALPL